MKIIYLESNLLEKSNTKPDKQAMKTLVNSGLFSEEESKEIIDDLFTNKKIHAFTHSKPWMDKYIKGIARMIVEEANGDKSKAESFINDSNILAVFDSYLNYARENRDKQDNPADFDKEFVDNLSFNDIKNFVDKYQVELDQQSKDELSKMEFNASSNYELVPINSYDELHSKFGGKLTGNSYSDGYAGDNNSGTAWCHTNDISTYNNWTRGGSKFFILMNKNFKDIPFNPKTNKEMEGKDDYGTSLIAILVDRYGNLEKATLRCNHVGVNSSADHQYETYAELSKLAGFNVEDKVKELGNFEESPLDTGYYHYDGESEIDEDLKESIVGVKVEDGLSYIGSQDFEGCFNLIEVILPESVRIIGDFAFSQCESLKYINLTNNIQEIGYGAFWGCTSLKSITIPSANLKSSAFQSCQRLKSAIVGRISGEKAFNSCTMLESVVLPDDMERLPEQTFIYCYSLKSITLPKNLKAIGEYAFYGCEHLKEIVLPDSVRVIGYDAFGLCKSLESITIPSSVDSIAFSIFKGYKNFSSKFRVRCYQYSAIEQYCIKNDIPYELI